MAAVDSNAEHLGIDTEKLMENAGSGVARVIQERFEKPSVCVVAGLGNNGGDALVTARFLEAEVFLLGRGSSIKTEEARRNWKAIQRSEFETSEIRDSSQISDFDEFDVIVDGILGTGVSGELREPVSSAVDIINSSDCFTVSVDVPTGVDPDIKGNQNVKKVDSNLVVALHDKKQAHKNLDSEIELVDIGIPRAAEEFVGSGDLKLIDRNPMSHKGDNGKVLVIGGGPYTGAQVLSSISALRAGCDLVRLATPSPQTAQTSPDLIIDELEGKRLTLENLEKIRDLKDWYDSVLIGPGLGKHTETIEAVKEIVKELDRIVLDADAIKALEAFEEKKEIIITPHSGELSTLTDIPENWNKRKETVEKFSQERDIVTLLKGHYDIISDGSQTRISRTGNEAMTVGGTGDVLAGICVSLLSRMSTFDAGCLGAYINGKAGDLARDQKGYSILASDMLDKISKAMASNSY